MSETLAQFFSNKPRLEVATRNLTFNKKLRRLVGQTIEKLHETTSPRDLADKVLKEINTPRNLAFLYGEEKLKSVDRIPFVYSRLELPIKLSCEAFTGIVSRSLFETQMMWQKSYITSKHKTLCGNLDVSLAPQKDMNRVYVTNGNVEVAMIQDIAPMTFLDEDVKDRHKYSKPQLATLIKLSEEHVLFLFSSKNDGLQRRFQIPFERVKNFTFKSLNDGYQQDGLQVVPKDLSGMEFEVSTYGEVVGEKRKGVNAPIWCFDQTNRGRQGDQGVQGRKGESGKDTQFGIRAGSLQLQLLEKGKRLVASKADYESALKDGTGWILPMNTSLIKSWSKS
jgi:hypothetical protein